SILPILTPLAFDPVRPFPHISNLSLNLAVLLRDRKGRERFAQVKVPETLPHLVPVSGGAPGGQGRLKPHRTMAHGFVWLEEVIAANLQALFPGAEIIEAHPFRVTRDAEMAIQELEAADLLDRVELGVRRRHFGCVSRLAIGDPMPDRLAGILSDNLKVDAGDVYRTRVPLALSRLAELSRIERLDLRDAPLSPAIDAGAWPDTDLFSCIRRHDILLHHPYDSFDPVVEFLQQAAADPQVLAIKMTLYRVGRHSPVVKALLDAKHNGKQVAVVVELKARFDEESNVSWARALERAGVHVVYGHVDLKVHAKLALVVRREGKKTRRYVHLSSGNYNVATAKVYTDIALFSCDEAIGADVMEVFNFLTGYSDLGGLTKLLAGPVNLRERLCQLIRREIDAQQQGASGRLIFKMNALVDPDIIQLLYQASQAGVRVDLLVRGICCLRPGVPGLSEHIQVSSIVGRFLEHSRIYYFRNGGSEQIYLGSADLMPRNLDRRVEVLFPVEDPGLLGRLRDEILAVYLTDTVKARRMQSDGSYVRVAPVAGEPAVSSQHELLQARGGRTFRSPAAAT
ncbi:MAG: polyphosphate kinase 1, partial [Acidobacteria bacterium]|nr:polyphosphate kinase 1 [Acidobacteriota bacterium]